MKHPFRFQILPFFTMGAGGLGLVLRLWLFSATDAKGLLPRGHIADSALFILSALVIGIVFLSTRQLTSHRASPAFRKYFSLAACLFGALGLLVASFIGPAGSAVRLASASAVACVAGGVVLLAMAVLAAFGKKCPYWLGAILTLALMVDTVAQCQVWGAVPQLQEYCFPLLASIFLILTAYYRTAVLAGQQKQRQLAFFSQCAGFFCCLCVNSQQWPLYLGLLLWACTQVYSIEREA